MRDHLLAVGRITGVYGVKGWLRVHSETHPADNIFTYQPWLVRRDQSRADMQTLRVIEFREHGKGYVVRLEGVEDRSRAETYSHATIYVDKHQLPTLPVEEFYWHELEGMEVFADTDGKAILLGKVAQMMATGANDVMVVRGCEGSPDERERLIPWLAHVVAKVDMAQGRIDVIWHPDD